MSIKISPEKVGNLGNYQQGSSTRLVDCIDHVPFVFDFITNFYAIKGAFSRYVPFDGDYQQGPVGQLGC